MAYLTQLSVTSSYAGGVLPQDTGVASALVNTMQQVGGSIGAAALSTVALNATATYLAAHQGVGPASATAATAAVHGYTVAFTVSAIVFGVAAILAYALLPSQRRTQSHTGPDRSGDMAGSMPAGT